MEGDEGSSQAQRARFDLERSDECDERRQHAAIEERKWRRLRFAILASVTFGAALTAIALGIYFGKLKPAADELARSEQLELQRQHDELERREAEAAKRAAELDRIQRQIDAVRIDAGLEPAPAGARSADTLTRHPRGRRPDAVPTATGPCKCIDPLDPLCGCLQH